MSEPVIHVVVVVVVDRGSKSVESNPEAKALVWFFPADEGGLQTPIEGDKFKTILRIDDCYHDCCFYLGEVRAGVTAGSTLLLPMDFLAPEIVLPKIYPGKNFLVQRGQKVIARGEFKEVQAKPSA